MTDQPPSSPASGGGAAAGGDFRRAALGCTSVVGLVLVVGVACTVMTSSGGTTDRPPTSFEAERMCETWVRERLKAPATAEFSGTRAQTTNVGENGADAWSVTGDVDAENTFGAKLRSAWSCDIRIDGDTWRGSATLLEAP